MKMYIGLLLGGLLILPDVLSAGNQSWKAHLENALKKGGIALDSSSLVQAAKNNPEVEVRINAVELLGERQERQQSEDLAELLSHDKEPRVREAAAIALAELGDERGLLFLRGQVTGPSPIRKRLSLAGELGKRGDYSGYPVLVEASASADRSLRVLAVSLVPRFFGAAKELNPPPVEVLATFIQDSEPLVRQQAAYALAAAFHKGGASSQLRGLAETMRDHDQEADVRKVAALALSSMDQWLECQRKPLSSGCPEGNKKFIEDCRRNPKGSGCDQILDLLSPALPTPKGS